MAAQALTLQASQLQPHTTTAAHRKLAFFLFLRFLSQEEKDDRTRIFAPALSDDGDALPGDARELIEFVLRCDADARRKGREPSQDRAAVLLQALRSVATAQAPTFASVSAALARFSWRTTLCFSFSGLKTLAVHAQTLATFPEAFQQGMAARAHLLSDVGESAPENWDGALGDKRIHALLLVSSPQLIARDAKERASLRASAREFNTGLTADAKPSTLRARINDVAIDAVGAEILHVEMGEDPFLEKDGQVQDFDWRLEHFGFRDGISQPFVLTDAEGGARPGPPPPGGGRPLPNGTWAPVAPGELFLGLPDEDGLVGVEPANATLRNGGTYLVWRKLEQDVAGFHAFLEERRADRDERARLAAHMMGRWPNGMPVVRHPDTQPATTKYDAATINAFRFESEDPHGHKCPVGSHVRRSNPRDHLDGEAARRHRILRRGISYGGSLIPAGSPGDGQPRGLLFVALNARIDLQFEFIQRDWLNSGELFGRAGAGLCPITGAGEGQHTDTCQEGGRIAPETHVPRFVTTRGGDYFFVPSLAALNQLKDLAGRKEDDRLPPDETSALYRPGEGSIRPGQELISKERLQRYARETIGEPGKPTPPVKRLVLAGQERGVVFLGRHADVAHVQTNSRVFTEKHYLDIGRALTSDNVIIGLPDDDADRKVRTEMLWRAYGAISAGDMSDLHREMSAFAAAKAREVLMCAGPLGRMDLLQQLGFYVPFVFMRQFFGVTGPNWLTPVAIASRYGRSHAAETPREWLRRAPALPQSALPYLTLQTWTRFAFAEVFTNIMRRADLAGMARQATIEMQQHIDQLIARERAVPSGERNLLAKLVEQWPDAPGSDEQKLRRTRLILMDLLGALLVNVGSPFCRVMELVLDQSGDLRSLLDAHGASNDDMIDRFIEESLRLNPAGAIQFRTAKADPETPNWNKLPSGGSVEDGDLIVMMVAAANRDWRVFNESNGGERFDQFSMQRDPNTYLTFGGPKNADAPHPGGDKDASPHRTALHHCWGERIGLLLVREMLKACSNLTLLRRAAGPKGETQPVLNLPYSLHVRFSPMQLS